MGKLGTGARVTRCRPGMDRNPGLQAPPGSRWVSGTRLDNACRLVRLGGVVAPRLPAGELETVAGTDVVGVQPVGSGVLGANPQHLVCEIHANVVELI